MTNRELGEKIGRLIREERQKTNELLISLNIAYERRAYLELGFSSMFDWLVKGFGYSNAAAYRRIEAASAMKQIPEVREKMESGALNLTTVSAAQKVFKAQEKLSGRKVSHNEKAEALREIENKSVVEAERELLKRFPVAADEVRRDTQKVISEDIVRHSMSLSKAASENLRRAKEVLSHKFPNGSDSEIVAYALQFLLEKVDPLKQEIRKENRIRPRTEIARKIQLVKNADAKCSFRDPLTGQVCGSKFQIQRDHIVPKALGGSDEPDNFRILCRQHNLHAAEMLLGEELMSRYWKRSAE